MDPAAAHKKTHPFQMCGDAFIADASGATTPDARARPTDTPVPSESYAAHSRADARAAPVRRRRRTVQRTTNCSFVFPVTAPLSRPLPDGLQAVSRSRCRDRASAEDFDHSIPRQPRGANPAVLALRYSVPCTLLFTILLSYAGDYSIIEAAVSNSHARFLHFDNTDDKKRQVPDK